MHPSPRTVTLLSTISLAALSTIPASASTYNTTDSTGEANVVVVARFKGDTVGDEQTGLNAQHPIHQSLSRWTQLKAEYTSQPDQPLGSVLSLDSYIRYASANQRRVSSFFPQDAAGSSGPGTQLTYIDLPHTQAEYESAASSAEPADTQLLQDVVTALDALDTPASAQWDTNQDRQVDHLSVLVQVPASEPVSAASPLLWPHHGRLSASPSVDGLTVSRYSLLPARHTETDSPDYTLGLSQATIKQEYLGSLGLPPLYRTEATRQEPTGPVGPWDPMADSADQLPLAQSREDLGWTSIPALPSAPGSQTVTLHGFGSSAGPQAVRIASPLTPDESFVLEYRRKSEHQPGAPVPDHSIPRSGLLIYRVSPTATRTDTTRTGQDGAGSDYLYVFRPGETGVHDAAGRLTEAALTAPTGRFAVAGPRYGVRSRLGASQLSARIQADAIVDSLGRNSGLIVEVLEQEEDSITFRLSVPDLSSQASWSLVQAPAGAPAAALRADAASLPSAASSPGGAVTATVRQPDGGYAVTSFSGGAWHDLGMPALDPTRQWGDPALAWLDERLYLLVPDNTPERTRLVLWAYAGTQWTQVAERSTTAPTDVPLLTALGTGLYTLAGGEGGQPQLLRLAPGQGLEPVGPPLPGPLVSPVLSLTGGSPTVLARQPDRPQAVTLRLEAGSWQETSSLQQALSSQAVGTWGSGPDERSLVVRATAAGSALVELLGPAGRVLRSVPATALPSALQQVQVAVQDGIVYLLTVSGPENLVEVYTSPLDLAGSWTRLGEAVAASSSLTALTVTAQEVLVLASAQPGTTGGLYRFPTAAVPARAAGSTTAPTTAPTASVAPTAADGDGPRPGVSAPADSTVVPSPQPSALPVPNPRPSPTRAQAPSTHVPAPSPQAAPTPARAPHPAASATSSPSSAPPAATDQPHQSTPLASGRPSQPPLAVPTASPSPTAPLTGSACPHLPAQPGAPSPGASGPSAVATSQGAPAGPPSSPASPLCGSGSRDAAPTVTPSSTPLAASAPAQPTDSPAASARPTASAAGPKAPDASPERAPGATTRSAAPEAVPPASTLPVPAGAFPLPPSPAPRTQGSSPDPRPLPAPVAQAAGASSRNRARQLLPTSRPPRAAVRLGAGQPRCLPLAVTVTVLAAAGAGVSTLLRARRALGGRSSR